MGRKKLVTTILLITFILGNLGGCTAPPPVPPAGGATTTPGNANKPTPTPLSTRVDSYLALAPKVLRAGQTERVSVSLFDGARPAAGNVTVALLRNGQRVAQGAGTVQGRGDVAMTLPKLSEGDYQLQVAGDGFSGMSPVRVEDGTLVFVETDKPIYKPGQTVHVRTITLDPLLKPAPGTVTVEVADAKGIKVFRKDVTSDDFGLAGVDLPVSPEPNLGVWKITARAGKRTAQVDVRIERYVLPKYEVRLNLPKDWYLAGEPITGTVAAEYSYGKPVQGEVEIKASRYVGTWQDFASVTKSISGTVEFQLPAVGYVSGVPGAKGMGNVRLDVTVREPATGYEEKTNSLLNIAATPVVLQLIPESVTFKPGLPMSLLVIAETPDKKPVDAEVRLDLTYTDQSYAPTKETRQVTVAKGSALVQSTPPANAISLSLSASGNSANSKGAYTTLALRSGHSPSGSFVHVEQANPGSTKVGDTAQFKVSATREATNFYYEVVARGGVVFSDFSTKPDIALTVTPPMAPRARLLVYQILSNSEVAADYVPFNVVGDYPHEIALTVSKEEVAPGSTVDVTVQTQGPAEVGLAAVDRSVFILAENRLNLQQVFAELERLYQTPQVELHEARLMDSVTVRGAQDVIADAGLVVLTNKQVPQGKRYEAPPRAVGGFGGPVPLAVPAAAAPAATREAAEDASKGAVQALAEVQRVRQFFPETWVWSTFLTDGAGKDSQRLTAPDSITTWMLRAVALSKQSGIGMAEAQLRVFQPFFVQIDLPYAAIRGEQFPVKVALYNYGQSTEEFQVELDQGDWFALTGGTRRTVRVAPNDVGGVSFTIRPEKLGRQQLKVTARSATLADAIVKDLLIEPEGVAREDVDNVVLTAGNERELPMAIPQPIVPDSARASLALTGSYMTQAIEGLEGLLKMPFGCGEQNMILFAPNVYVSRYLKATNQMKPEVMAKAENLMLTGYQRELTYRRNDGSFSAFGQQDKEGSLWLSAFVMKTFAEAKGLIYVDDTILNATRNWIAKHQKADGSFDPVGFVIHQDMMGGLSGKTSLTAYLAVALRAAGDEPASAKAIRYLEGALAESDDPYALALGSYALALAKSPRAPYVAERLLKLARESDGGLYWGAEGKVENPLPGAPRAGVAPLLPPKRPNQSAAIETTGYATLALVELGDRVNAGRAARWLVSRRNAYGGFGSTQDTVVGLQALSKYAEAAKSDVDATVTLRAGKWENVVRVTPENADVLQVLDVPAGVPMSVSVQGKGQVVMQAVRRYNVPAAEEKALSAFQIDVTYGTGQVAVDDQISVDVRVKFTPPEPVQAGMVVLDVAVPTGFAAVEETLAALAKQEPKVKRYDVAGRKVIIYIEDMLPNDQIGFSFKARALYPVRAQAVTSQAYSYYRPEWRGEALGGALVVVGGE